MDKNEAVYWHMLERDNYYSKAKAYGRRANLPTSESKYCRTHAHWLLKRLTANLHISVVVLGACVSCITIQRSLQSLCKAAAHRLSYPRVYRFHIWWLLKLVSGSKCLNFAVYTSCMLPRRLRRLDALLMPHTILPPYRQN